MTKPLPLEHFPIHLGLGARAVAEPKFTGHEWYGAYVDRHAAQGNEGTVVRLDSFSERWTSWVMHPAGDEAVIYTEGEIVLIQELPDGPHKVTLGVGEYAVNPRGVSHTADVTGKATAL